MGVQVLKFGRFPIIHAEIVGEGERNICGALSAADRRI
jgi:hypothetical protein